MTEAGARARADESRVSVLVKVGPEEAFRVFTGEIDQWWRRGVKYRVAGGRRGTIAMEPGVGGRLFETFKTGYKERVVENGRVSVWAPPERLVFEWRSVTFDPDERTEVEVTFEPNRAGTLVTVTHRGWSAIRPDHPVRHGEDVETFIRTMALWWGDLMTSMRVHVADKDKPEKS